MEFHTMFVICVLWITCVAAVLNVHEISDEAFDYAYNFLSSCEANVSSASGHKPILDEQAAQLFEDHVRAINNFGHFLHKSCSQWDEEVDGILNNVTDMISPRDLVVSPVSGIAPLALLAISADDNTHLTMLNLNENPRLVVDHFYEIVSQIRMFEVHKFHIKMANRLFVRQDSRYLKFFAWLAELVFSVELQAGDFDWLPHAVFMVNDWLKQEGMPVYPMMSPTAALQDANLVVIGMLQFQCKILHKPKRVQLRKQYFNQLSGSPVLLEMIELEDYMLTATSKSIKAEIVVYRLTRELELILILPSSNRGFPHLLKALGDIENVQDLFLEHGKTILRRKMVHLIMPEITISNSMDITKHVKNLVSPTGKKHHKYCKVSDRGPKFLKPGPVYHSVAINVTFDEFLRTKDSSIQKVKNETRPHTHTLIADRPFVFMLQNSKGVHILQGHYGIASLKDKRITR